MVLLHKKSPWTRKQSNGKFIHAREFHTVQVKKFHLRGLLKHLDRRRNPLCLFNFKGLKKMSFIILFYLIYFWFFVYSLSPPKSKNHIYHYLLSDDNGYMNQMGKSKKMPQFIVGAQIEWQWKILISHCWSGNDPHGLCLFPMLGLCWPTNKTLILIGINQLLKSNFVLLDQIALASQKIIIIIVLFLEDKKNPSLCLVISGTQNPIKHSD